MKCCRVAAVIGLSGLLAAAAAVGAGSAGGTVPDRVADASRAADEEIAEAGLFVAADFPAGWTESPPETADDGDIEAAAKRIASCKRYLALRAMGKKQPRAESSDFELGGSNIDNSVAVFRSTGAANAAMKLFEHSSVLTCFNEVFTVAFKAQGLVIALDDVDVGDVGDAAAAYEGTASDADETIGLGTAAVRVGRAVAIYSYVVDAEEVVRLLPQLVDASVARLAAAT